MGKKTKKPCKKGRGLLVLSVLVTVLALCGLGWAAYSTVRSYGPTAIPDIVGGGNPLFDLFYFGLVEELLLAALSVVLLILALILFLAGLARRRRFKRAMKKQKPEPSPLGNPPDTSAPTPEAQTSARPIRVYRSQVQGATIRGAGRRSRQQVLATLSVGDLLICRSLPRTDDGTAIGLFTMNGEQVGYLDRALVREIKALYPGHRIGTTVETVRGGRGLPYTGELRVTVYDMG